MNQQKDENGHRNDFMLNLFESMRPGRDRTCDPLNMDHFMFFSTISKGICMV